MDIEQVREYTLSLAGVTEDQPFGDDVITFRGANLHWTANLLGGTEAQMENAAFLRSRIGKTVVDKGFMSSGTHKDSSWSAAVDYTIFVHKGVRGMYVDPISENSGEYEFLFGRDTEFKVHMIRTGSNGRIRELVLEALPTKRRRLLPRSYPRLYQPR